MPVLAAMLSALLGTALGILTAIVVLGWPIN